MTEAEIKAAAKKYGSKLKVGRRYASLSDYAREDFEAGVAWAQAKIAREAQQTLLMSPSR